MAGEHPGGMPQRPEGLQRPGVPGAGHLLDPAVRGEIREHIHDAVHGTAAQVREEKQDTEPAASPAPASHRAGPFPHGDVDLSFMTANVPAEPVKPRRARGARRFYFLPDATPAAPPEPPGPTPPPGPKPG